MAQNGLSEGCCLRVVLCTPVVQVTVMIMLSWWHVFALIIIIIVFQHLF